MVYSEKFVACLICNGKVVREIREDGNDVLRLPFGSEYAIRIKNMNSTRVVVGVSIDDKDVLDGSKIVVEPNETHDIEGFMDNGTIKNKFKFIEKTQEISDHRGDRVGDGLIRIEYQFEKKPAVIEKRPIIEPYRYPKPYKYPWYDKNPWNENPKKKYPYPFSPYDVWCNDQSSQDDAVYGSSGACGSEEIVDGFEEFTSSPINFSKKSFKPQSILRSLNQQNEDGITVKGSQTNIDYKTTFVRELEEQTHVIVMNLKGKTKKNKPIKMVVSTKNKITCETCGHKNDSKNKFCTNCGTSLI